MSQFLNRLRAPSRGALPTGALPGDLVFDTTDGKLKQFDGNGWRDTNSDKQFPVTQIDGLQASLDAKLDDAQLGVANGIAQLDSGGKIVVAQLPALAVTSTVVVADLAARNALTGVQEGDVVVVTATSRTYIANAGDTATDAGWTELATPADTVLSVNAKTGAVVLNHTDVGAAPATHGHAVGDVTGLQGELDSKAPLNSPALSGTPTAPSAAAGTNTNQIATTAFVRTAIQAVPAGLQKASGLYGDGTATEFTITPGFAGPFVVTVSDAASGEVVYPDINVGTGATPTSVVITHAEAPALNSMRYTLIGG